MGKKSKNANETKAEQAGAPAAVDGGTEQAEEPREPSELERLRNELEQAREQRLRALADLQNYHRQSLINEREAREDGAAGVMHGVITVLDHFDLALQQDPERAGAATVLEGVRLIQSELERVLREHGAERIEPAAGDAFDPHLHEAVGREASSAVAPGAIVRTLQPGYRLDGRLLRPAKVMLAPTAEDGGMSENAAKRADAEAEE